MQRHGPKMNNGMRVRHRICISCLDPMSTTTCAPLNTHNIRNSGYPDKYFNKPQETIFIIYKYIYWQ